MDYDESDLASSYDAGRGYSQETLRKWMDVIGASVAEISVATILDLGCGTGRFSGALASRFNANVVAIDPSRKMLAQARRKRASRVALARAGAESVPLRDSSCDMVFMSMVFHHLSKPGRAARECLRVLRSGGTVCLRAATIERIFDYAYVNFFDGVDTIMRTRLTSEKLIEGVFEAAGFESVSHQLVPSEVAESWEQYAGKLAQGGDSILAQLSRHDFGKGLRNLREYAIYMKADGNNERVIEPVDYFVFRRA